MNPNTVRWEKHNILPVKQSPRYKAYVYDKLVLDSAEIELNSFIRNSIKRKVPPYYPFILLLQIGWKPIWVNDIIQLYFEYIGYLCGLEKNELYKVPEAINEVLNNSNYNKDEDSLHKLINFNPFQSKSN